MLLRPRNENSCRQLHPGWDQEYHGLKGCPDCGGKGYWVNNPFAEWGKRFYQCPTCKEAKDHFDKHGTIPTDIAAALVHNA